MKLWREFLRFSVVGVIGFGVDVAVLYAAAPLMGWHAARVLSFLAAATTTWALNRRITFQAASSVTGVRNVWRQYLRYLFTMLGGGAINYLVYATTLHFSAGTGTPALGVALGSIAGLFANFASARYLVFRTKAPTGEL